MKVFGLTGGIASGKSTVASILRQLGVQVLDADVVAREAVLPGSEGLQEIVDTFGPSYLLADGQLDRKALGELIFQTPQAREQLNAILHPKIAILTAQHLQRYAESGLCCAVYEVPLLFENRLQHTFSATVLVAIPEDLQKQRLCSREGLSPEEAQARINAQMPLSEKRKLADHILENTQTLEALREKVEQLWKELCPEHHTASTIPS